MRFEERFSELSTQDKIIFFFVLPIMIGLVIFEAVTGDRSNKGEM